MLDIMLQGYIVIDETMTRCGINPWLLVTWLMGDDSDQFPVLHEKVLRRMESAYWLLHGMIPGMLKTQEDTLYR